MRRPIATLAASVVALAIPTAAQAAWSAPESLTGGVSEPSCCGDLAFASDGRGAALWSEHSQEAHTNGTYTGFHMPTRTAGGSWLAHTHRPHGAAVEPLTFSLAGDGGLVLFGLRLSQPGSEQQRTAGLAARFGHLTSSGITIVDTQRLLGRRTFDSPEFAANAAGEAVAAWAVRNSSSGPRPRVKPGVYVRLRRAGGRFGKVRRLAHRPPVFSFLTAAVGERGDTAVVWRRGGKILARVAPPGGDFGKRLLVGAGKGRPSVAVGPQGQVVVAWMTRTRADSVPLATMRGADGDFRAARPLGGSADGFARLVTLVDRAGRGLVGWRSASDSPHAHVTTLGAGRPQNVDLPSGAATVDDLALALDGRVAAVATGAGVYVRTRSASGSWDENEQASPSSSDGASVAFDPLTGQPNVVYQVPIPGEPTESTFAVARVG